MIDRLVAEFAADFPDDYLIAYRNHVFGFECLIRISKAKWDAALASAKKKEAPPPLWRHGDAIVVRPPRGADGSISPVL